MGAHLFSTYGVGVMSVRLLALACLVLGSVRLDALNAPATQP